MTEKFYVYMKNSYWPLDKYLNESGILLKAHEIQSYGEMKKMKLLHIISRKSYDSALILILEGRIIHAIQQLGNEILNGKLYTTYIGKARIAIDWTGRQ